MNTSLKDMPQDDRHRHDRAGRRPIIALVPDTNDWAFANICTQLELHLCNRYQFLRVPFSKYENIVEVLLETREADLVHFFWRHDADLIGAEIYHEYLRSLDLDREQFDREVLGDQRISTAVYDHLGLGAEEIPLLESLFKNKISGYYVCSPKLESIYRSISCYPAPLATLPDGVDTTLFFPRRLERLAAVGRREFVVGWCGNSTWAGGTFDFKGVRTIIEPALSLLRSEGRAIRAHFADRAIDFRPFSTMPDYYAEVDVYVCASEIEGTPNPVLEAMACGVPIVSTDVGIVSDALGPLQQEFILKERSPQALCEKLRLLLDTAGLLETLSQENLQSVSAWTWKQKAEDFSPYFEQLLQRKELRTRVQAAGIFSKGWSSFRGALRRLGSVSTA